MDFTSNSMKILTSKQRGSQIRMDAATSATHLVPHADPADVTRLQKSLDNAVDTHTPEKRLDTKPQ